MLPELIPHLPAANKIFGGIQQASVAGVAQTGSLPCLPIGNRRTLDRVWQNCGLPTRDTADYQSAPPFVSIS
jgi:hypothetical protein